MSQIAAQPETLRRLATDEPQTDPESDLLGYAPFARHLADAIVGISSGEGMVIGLYGPWGSGKTTLVNFVRHYLNAMAEDARPLVLEFNPWWFSGTEDLTRKYFAQLSEQFGQNTKAQEDLRNAIAELGELASKFPFEPVKFLTR